MPDRTILVYTSSDLGLSGHIPGSTFTASATAAPTAMTVTDMDPDTDVFNDGQPGNFAQAPTQFLNGTLDGVTYVNTPTNPENEFQVFDSSGAQVGFIYNLQNSNSNSAAAFQGYVSTFRLIPGETYSIGTIDGLGDANYSDLLTCFVSGTCIVTERGEIAIENLQIGDRVMTRDNGLQPIRWIGASKVRGQGKFAPITFRAGVLGNTRDLRVSPLHRMLLTGWKAEMLFGETEVLACAKHLVDGGTIFSDPCAEVTYYHLMFDQHEIVFAEGCPSESFYPGPATLGSIEHEVREELFTLFPELRSTPAIYGQTARRCLRGRETAVLRR